jgi:hypothetical protein
VLQEFANHAFSLRLFLECLLSGGTSPNATNDKTSERNNHKCSFHDASDTPSTNDSIRDGADNVDRTNEGSLGTTEFSDVDNQYGLSQQEHQMGDSYAAEGSTSLPSTIVPEEKESILKNDFDNFQSTEMGPSSKSKS